MVNSNRGIFFQKLTLTSSNDDATLISCSLSKWAHFNTILLSQNELLWIVDLLDLITLAFICLVNISYHSFTIHANRIDGICACKK